MEMEKTSELKIPVNSSEDTVEQSSEQSSKKTVRVHRVGSLTAGVTILLYGILFLIQEIIPSLNYEVIFKCWPAIFILLGIEILFTNKKKNVVFKYDIGSFFIIFFMMCFAVGMAGAEWVMKYGEQYGFVHF